MGFHPWHAKVTLDPFHATGLSLPWSQRFGRMCSHYVHEHKRPPKKKNGKNIANESAANN